MSDQNPYDPPHAPVADQEQPIRGIGDFKDPTTLTRWTRFLLYAQIGVSVVALVLGGLEYQLLDRVASGFYTSETEMAADADANATSCAGDRVGGRSARCEPEQTASRRIKKIRFQEKFR